MVARLLTVLLLAFAVTANASAPPNIVFILIDDLGWADVGFNGGKVPTPHMDKLANTGVTFDAHYVAPVCSPTRTGLMTGRFWSRFDVTTPQNDKAMPDDTVTLPRLLRAAGYDTAITGKWHLGSLPEWGPNHFGFDHSYGSLAGGVGPWNHFYKRGPFSKTWHRNEQLIDESGHVTDLITAEAVQWLEKRTDKPFFLYMPYTAVHLPVKEPDAYVNRVPPDITDLTARHYAACVIHLDDAVGKVVSTLEKLGKRDNTLIVFSSDNGGSTAPNNGQTYPPDDYPDGRCAGNNKPFRDEKGSVYEGGIRVAAFANWPGKLPVRHLKTPVSIVDWMPTLAHVAGAPSQTNLRWDGQNIWDCLTTDSPIPDRAIYTVGPNWRARALRFGPWKLVEQTKVKGSAPKYELYDLERDPYETADLVKAEPARVAELLQKLHQVAGADKDSAVPKTGIGKE